MAAEYDSTKVTEFAGTTAYRVVSDWSILVCFDLDAATNYSHIVGCQQSATTYGWELRAGNADTGRDISLTRMTTNYFAASGSGNNVRIGNNVLAVACKKDIQSAPSVAINGVAVSLSNTAGGGSGDIAAGTGNLKFGKRQDDFTKLDGAVYFFALWHRQLTQAECIDLSVNPYQFLIPA
jgi:hypothetical protein